MKKTLIVLALVAVTVVFISGAFLSLSIYSLEAIADSDDNAYMDQMEHTDQIVQKYRFTETMDSSSSPGQGHEGHQIVKVLEPSDGIIYSGTLTYVTSEPVDIVVIHEMDPADSRGQAIWRISNDTVYGWTFVDIDSKAGSFEYAGAGLLLHTGGDTFTATITTEGSAQESQYLNLTSSLNPQ